MVTTLIVIAAIGLGVWALVTIAGSRQDAGPTRPQFHIPEGKYGSLPQQFQMRERKANGAEWEVQGSYDTVNRVSIDEVEAWADVEERKALRDEYGIVRSLDGTGYTHISAFNPASIEPARPNAGLSAARQAQAVLKRKPDAQVHFSGLSQEDCRAMKQALGLLYITRIDMKMDGDGEVIVLRNPKVSDPVRVMRDGDGGFIVDPEGGDLMDDGRYKVRFVEGKNGVMHAYCEPQF